MTWRLGMPHILAPKVLSVTASICFLHADGDSGSAEILYYLGIEKPTVKHHCYFQPEAPILPGALLWNRD